MAARSQPLRRDDQPAFVLHTYRLPRDEPHRRGVHRGARPGRDGRARREAAALGAARPAAGIPAAAAVVVGRARAQDADQGRMARRAAARRRLGARLRLLPQRAAAEAAAARGSASAAVRELRDGARAISRQAASRRRCCGASSSRCWPSWATRCRWCAKPTPARPSIRRPATITPSTAARAARPPEPGARGCRWCAARRCWRWPTGATSTARRRPRPSG